MATEESSKGQKGTKYQIRYSKQFRQDLRRLQKAGRYDLAKLHDIIQKLANGEMLEPRHRHHRLQGDLCDFYECHIQGDWLLIYERKEEILILIAQRTGTHSSLFGM